MATPAGDAAVEPTNVVYKQGWLDKRGDLRKNWKRRHFVLKDNTLKYYKKATDAKPQGEIPLDGCGVDFVPEEKYSKRYCFELHTTVAKKRVYVLVSDSGPDMQEWLAEIRKAVLRIRKVKSRTTKEKLSESRRVTQVLEEQDAEALRRLSREHGPAVPTTVLSPRTMSKEIARPVEMQAVDTTKRTRAPSLPYEDEKYDQYMNFLNDTNNYQRRGTVTEPSPYYKMKEDDSLMTPEERRAAHSNDPYQQHPSSQKQEWWNQSCTNCSSCSVM